MNLNATSQVTTLPDIVFSFEKFLYLQELIDKIIEKGLGSVYKNVGQVLEYLDELIWLGILWRSENFFVFKVC